MAAATAAHDIAAVVGLPWLAPVVNRAAFPRLAANCWAGAFQLLYSTTNEFTKRATTPASNAAPVSNAAPDTVTIHGFRPTLWGLIVFRRAKPARRRGGISRFDGKDLQGREPAQRRIWLPLAGATLLPGPLGQQRAAGQRVTGAIRGSSRTAAWLLISTPPAPAPTNRPPTPGRGPAAA